MGNNTSRNFEHLDKICCKLDPERPTFDWRPLIITAGVITGSAIACPIALAAIGAAGFTTAGVAAGSVAASVQTATTAAGSSFAVLQSIGATGALTAGATAGAVGTGATVGAAVGAGVGAGVNKLTEGKPSEEEGVIPVSITMFICNEKCGRIISFIVQDQRYQIAFCSKTENCNDFGCPKKEAGLKKPALRVAATMCLKCKKLILKHGFSFEYTLNDVGVSETAEGTIDDVRQYFDYELKKRKKRICGCE